MPNIRLNENEEIVRTIREGLAAKGGYCPCRVEIKEEYKCMCQEFRDQIADPDFEGYCHCMLYYKERDRKSSVEKGDHIHGFVVTGIRYVSELKGFFVEMVHEKTGAQLVWVENGAENKLFCIGFKTIPEDSTGVFHILEHSVLCGSEKYPVKEPFVDLLKTSMNTFLNAITFDDKTMYPVSSRNRKDFLNLTGVYLDAVFAPRLLSDPNIFYQEGWHIAQEGDRYIYNGVVFNEMKGSMSSDDRIIGYALQANLLPGTNYVFNSGGNPENIPDLTYEQFCNTYRRFYNPTNSRIFLDGDIPLDETLELIDSYLSRFERGVPAPEISLEIPEPVSSENRFAVGEDEDTADRTRVSLGKVIGTWKDREKIAALNVLSKVIAGTNESPLKKAIISSGLAQQFEIDTDNPVALPFVAVYFKNVKDGEEDNVIELMRSSAAGIAEEGLDKRDLYATINHLEYMTKDVEEPQALIRCIESFNSWLYGGDPLQYLDHSGLFDSLRSMVETGRYEELLKEFFADPAGTAVLITRPSKELTEELQRAEDERVSAITSEWTEDQVEENRSLNEKLLAWQSTPDTPEQTATIPVLELSEIGETPSFVGTDVTETDGVSVLRHDINTNGIVHESLYFRLTDLDADTLTRFASAVGLFTNLPTSRYSVVELQREMKNTLGHFSVALEPCSFGRDNSRCVPFLSVRFSSLASLAEEAEKLAVHIITETDFSESAAIRNLINQKNEALKQLPVTRGHSLARTVALAGENSVNAATELVSGLSQLRWVKTLAEGFEGLSAEYSEMISQVISRAVCRDRLTVSVTSDSGHEPRTAIDLLKEGAGCPEYAEYSSSLPARSAIVIPAPVGYSSQACDSGNFSVGYSGVSKVISQMISYAFLWNEVRVKGGAYGTGLNASRNGSVSTYSYRDPSPVKSIETNGRIGDFLREYAESGQKTDGFVISAIAELDPLLSPSEMGKSADSDWFRGFTAEDAAEERRQMLGINAEDLRRFAGFTDRFSAGAPYCIVAGESLVAGEEGLERLSI
ncbi:MAG: insulinase family protein [Oscillospiraceae bacterium]|nr:insulinase family protein [Oscillospiraceae bacterium]